MAKLSNEGKQMVLLRKFHAVCGQAKLSTDAKAAIVESYGHQSSKDMGADELAHAIEQIEPSAPSTKKDESDVWRKRVMAAIGAWLRARNMPEGADKIKAIACRAAKMDDFNKIPLTKLRALYNGFVKEGGCIAAVTEVQRALLDATANKN